MKKNESTANNELLDMITVEEPVETEECVVEESEEPTVEDTVEETVVVEEPTVEEPVFVAEDPSHNLLEEMNNKFKTHPVIVAMETGNCSLQQYADWVTALYVIYHVLNNYDEMNYEIFQQLKTDLELLPKARSFKTAKKYTNSLVTNNDIRGTVYVLINSYFANKEKIKLNDFPTNHLDSIDMHSVQTLLNQLRDDSEIAEECENCYATLLNILNEINNDS